MFSNSEHKQLVEMECNPDHYSDHKAFKDAYLATKFLSKADFLSTNIDLKAEALRKFQEAEIACGRINSRGYHHLTINREIGASLHHAVLRKIDSILGDFSADELVHSSDWGPGVTLLIKGVDTSPVNKFRCENGTTRSLEDLMGNLYAIAYPLWKLSERKIFAGNKVITVPKNSKTDRTIAVEPGLNLWFQKGVGAMIRKRLRWVGVDLNDQKRNQLLSKVGSETKTLATVDFSSASDTISVSTVRELIPPGWYDVMDVLRSPFGALKGKQLRHEKFSSMGNGFTFELESLIFFGIAHAVCEKLQLSTKDVSVYGDDVIIPVAAYDLFVKVSEFYGFTVNRQKSFSSGEFRESCGAHWYNGQDCTPYYLKEVIEGESRIYHAANSVRRLSMLQGFEACDGRFYTVWRYLRRKVRKPHLISEGYGDGGFVVNLDEACPSRARHGIEGYLTTFLADIPKVYQSDDHAVLLARLWANRTEELPEELVTFKHQDRLAARRLLKGETMEYGNKTPLRRLVKQKVKRLFVRRWVNLGPWI
jgi:hypothetical protein